jgi:hypothetical protein
VSNANLVGQYLRSSAWWRLDSAGVSARQVARSVVALLDAAAYIRELPDDDPDLAALAAAGCFSGTGFDPGPEGAGIVRGWHLNRETTAGPRDLLTALAQTAAHPPPARGGDGASTPEEFPSPPAEVPAP